GVLLGDWLEGMFEDPRDTAIQILITAAILFSTLLVRRGVRRIDSLRSILIGIGQAIAIVPGISRSGTTIATALYLKVEPREAARFSFLLSIPAILGAAVFEAPKMAHEIHTAGAGLLAIGFVVSMVVGWLSIAALLRIVQEGKFGWFGIWCVVVGIAGLLLLR
ncbi:MAG: undecaprenyl-diphosphate phosphatase, partial [Candidatus Eisenbacteria bacterium]|nr:undecaprenyl-diphosphate phosphatase [Candidatus Eisenbacteria bacterium]